MSAAKSGDGAGGDALAARPSSYLPAQLAGEYGSVSEILRLNLGGEQLSPFDLERVKVPAGGGTYWMVSTPEKPSGAPVEALSGVIAYQRLGRTYWAQPFGAGDGGGTPPDCYSDDAVTGVGNPGGECAKCRFAQFGSKDDHGDAQACKMSRLLFLVTPDSLLPRVVVVPPGSLKNLRGYMTLLTAQGLPHWTVVTRLRLQKVKNKAGIDYAQIVPEVGARLTPDDVRKVREFAENLRPVFEQVRVDRTDLDGAAEAKPF